MHRILQATAGPHKGTVYALSQRLSIGRDADNDIQILDPKLSRHHACIIVTGGGRVVLADLSSKNGTFVGDEEVREQELTDGVSFRLGKSVLVYRQVRDREFTSMHSHGTVKVLSGPAHDMTASTVPQAAQQKECTDPLHEIAVRDGWPYCPRCGRKLV